MEIWQKYKSLLVRNYINTPLRLRHFLAQADAESGLKPISENLNYSAKRLNEVFPKYFPTIEKANKYANKPEAIANIIYANRMGNGDEDSGDGYKFRGRGYFQVTGRTNYGLLSVATGIDYLCNPDLLLTEADSMISALWYWNSNNLNKYADKNDLDSISDIINIGRLTSTYGDANGFKHRKEMLEKYQRLIK